MAGYCKMVYWKVFLRNASFVWRSLPLFISKRELIQFLREFNSKEWPEFGDIVQARIVRLERIASTMMWHSEIMGYVDVTPAGTFYHINL